MLPKDPAILLSYVNTKLRDFYPTLTEFCKSENVTEEEICTALAKIDYTYSAERNSFI